MRTRVYIAAVVAMMAASVVFGIGATVVLAIPSLQEAAGPLLAGVVGLSLIAGPAIGWWLAPRLRLRYGRSSALRGLRGHREPDGVVSGGETQRR